MAYRSAVKARIKQPRLFVRQIAAESSFNPCAGSPAGAVGIAQIMPGTSSSWRVDPYDPKAALDAAAAHMGTYERELGSYPVALAAYNAGPGAVARFHGVPPYPETQRYVEKIMGHEDITGLHHEVFSLPSRFDPTFRRRLTALLRDVRHHGGTIGIASGFRDYHEQTALWKNAKRKTGTWQSAKRIVAPPGCSNHNKGLAADLRGDLALAHKLAGKHHLAFGIRFEPWHVSLSGY
jgi:hypothetical protein